MLQKPMLTISTCPFKFYYSMKLLTTTFLYPSNIFLHHEVIMFVGDKLIDLLTHVGSIKTNL